MADPVAVKRALARLASDADADRAVISQAEAAATDLDAAVAFVEDVGVVKLAVAVERQRTAGNTDATARGERALRAFRRYRRAAGTTVPASSSVDRTHDFGERPVEQHGYVKNGSNGSGGSNRSNGSNRSEGTPPDEMVADSWQGVQTERRSKPNHGGDDAATVDLGLDGWRTLDGDQFHRGDGTDIRSAPEQGRR